jgi:hypothetical protein
VGLLDEILKQLEEAQREAEGRSRPRPARPRPVPEREADEDGAEWEEDEAARPGHAPHIPSRRQPEPVAPPQPEAAPARTVVSSAAALSPSANHVQPAIRIRALVSNRESIRDVFIAREILGPPPGLRHFRRKAV